MYQTKQRQLINEFTSQICKKNNHEGVLLIIISSFCQLCQLCHFRQINFLRAYILNWI